MNQLNSKIVCFTGHRQMAHAAARALPGLLEEVIIDLYHQGATTFRAGGAVGFDTIAALKVLELKDKLPGLRLELILPCRNQTEHWVEPDVQAYNYILERADSHRFLFETYIDGCMLERDRRLIQGSDVCVAYCNRSQGGTAYTCAQALKAGLKLINLNDRL